MSEILRLLPPLFCLIVLNIALGTYHNVGVQKFEFDKARFLGGIAKGAILAASFVGLAYCFQATDLSAIGVTPVFLCNAAIGIYAGKVLLALAKILGVKIETKAPVAIDKEEAAE